MWWSSSSSLGALALVALGGLQGASARCAWQHEDCSHSGCCQEHGKKCYKKNSWWAACMHSCQPGVHHSDPPHHRDPWSCDVISAGHRDCADKDEDCAHLGCCKQAGHKCFRKNPQWAGCRESCKKGETKSEGTTWTCEEVTVHENSGTGTEYGKDGGRSTKEEVTEVEKEITNMNGGHSEDLSQNWRGGLQATHFWDCNGGGCDACTLMPWDLKNYKYAPHYAPTDPEKHGGNLYGEKLWLTGAASDKLTQLMGPDTDCCGADGDGGGGCGQCLMVKVRDSNHPDWLAVIMKKNRCPPWSNGCNEVHMDVAVPGFDNLQYSTANVCGESSRGDTYIQKHHSAICGSVAPRHCNCWQLPGDTAGQRHIRDGCLLFKEWGWHYGTPKMDYRPVPCPQNFINWVKNGKAFDYNGVIEMEETWNTTATAKAGAAKASSFLKPPKPVARLPMAKLGGLAAACAVVGGLALGVRIRRQRQRAGMLLLTTSEEDGPEQPLEE